MDVNEDIEIREDVPSTDVIIEPQNVTTLHPKWQLDIDEPLDMAFRVGGAFPALGAENPELRHANLTDTDAPDLHPIRSITGLEERLLKLEGIGSKYVEERGLANYWRWADHFDHDDIGLFVGLNDDHEVIIAGRNSVGVVVRTAAFIGGQTNPPHGADWALVANDGIVDVQYTGTLHVGDRCQPNEYGVAVSSRTRFGYPVLAVDQERGIATISLGLTADQAVDLYNFWYNLDLDMTAIKPVVTAAAAKAQQALELAQQANTGTEQMRPLVEGAVAKSDAAETKAQEAITTAESIRDLSLQARDAAIAASNDAMEAKTAAQTTANEIWAKAEHVESEMLSFVADISTYSVGEYSQANGLTAEQARSILEDGFIYVPTDAHEEASYGYENFEPGKYYTWTGIGWTESAADSVIFSTTLPTPQEGKLWYHNGPASSYADAYTLYKYYNGRWMAVANLKDNMKNRVSSLIKQEADEITAEVVSARGGFVSISERIDDQQAQIDSISSFDADVIIDAKELPAQPTGEFWTEKPKWDIDLNAWVMQGDPIDHCEPGCYAPVEGKPDQFNQYFYTDGVWSQETHQQISQTVAELSLKTDANSASIQQTVTALGGEDGKINVASIFQHANEEGSTIKLTADVIELDGKVTFTSMSEETKKNLVKETKVEYVLWDYDDPAHTPPDTAAWSTTAPAHEDDKFMWQRTTVKYADDSTETSKTCVSGADGDSPLMLVIASSNGNIFKNGEISTTLQAVVYKGVEDVTANYAAANFKWRRKSDDAAADATWNAAHAAGSKTQVITADDVYCRATFFCELVE